MSAWPTPSVGHSLLLGPPAGIGHPTDMRLHRTCNEQRRGRTLPTVGRNGAGRHVASAQSADAACPLSARELEVALLVAGGATNREIAAALAISPRTASAHIEHILRKLGVARRTQIAAWAARF
jgi:DNA-binding CsgD family transcriptional regulator